MREFFRCWRRKAGVVTLVMAFGLYCLWLRSQFIIDKLQIGLLILTSQDGIMTSDLESIYGRPFDLEWYTYEPEDVPTPSPIARKFSHWTCILPLTVLSAYLILWKPRKRTGAEHA